MASARTCLPVPVSPSTRIVMSLTVAAFLAWRSRGSMVEDPAKKPWSSKRHRSSWSAGACGIDPSLGDIVRPRRSRSDETRTTLEAEPAWVCPPRIDPERGEARRGPASLRCSHSRLSSPPRSTHHRELGPATSTPLHSVRHLTRCPQRLGFRITEDHLERRGEFRRRGRQPAYLDL